MSPSCFKFMVEARVNLLGWYPTIPAKKQGLAGCGLSSDSFYSSSIAEAMNSSQTESADSPRSAIPYFLAGIADPPIFLLCTNGNFC